MVPKQLLPDGRSEISSLREARAAFHLALRVRASRTRKEVQLLDMRGSTSRSVLGKREVSLDDFDGVKQHLSVEAELKQIN